MRSLLPLLLLGLAGCYSAGAQSPSPDEYTPSLYGNGWYTEPLHASVWFDEYTGFASFEVSRSAHVAVFALQPGGSMRMIYPAIGYGGRQLFSGGRHQIHTAAPTYRRGSSYRHASFYNHSLDGGFAPTYIIMIASERPLDTRRFLATGTHAWLNRVAATWNPYTATELLAAEIVPRPAVTDWTVAYHMIWPNGLRDPRDYRPRYTWVSCPGNLILSVPTEAVRRGLVYCPTSQTPVGDSTNADTQLPKIGDRIAGRPTPPGWMGPAETNEVELREAMRRVAERRNRPEESMETPLPSWRRAMGERPGRGEREEAVPAAPGITGGEAGRALPRRPAMPVTGSRPATPDARPASPRAAPSRATPSRATPSRVEPVERAEPRSRPAPSRAERPSRPAPKASPAASRPAQKASPRPSRPAPKPRPRPKPKPKEGGGGGEGAGLL